MTLRFWTALWMAASLTGTLQASILESKRLLIDFTRQEDAAAKATWSDQITVSKDGLGWQGNAAESRNGWIQTKPLAIGLSWRPATGASMEILLSPAPKPVILADGQTMTPFGGTLFVRHSPDLEHWSNWQALSTAPMKLENGRGFTGTIAVPWRDREDYQTKAQAYAQSDVPWRSDEEALVRSIVAKDPGYFSHPAPFIGYVEFLFEGPFDGDQRITTLNAAITYGMSGAHAAPKDPNATKVRNALPWSFKSPALALADGTSIPEEKWRPLLDRIRMGQTEKEVLAVLQAFSFTRGPGAGGGGAHMRIYRLDPEWSLRCDYQDQGGALFNRQLVREARADRPAAKDLLPMTLRTDAVASPSHSSVMEVSGTEVRLKRQKGEEWVVAATIPMDLGSLIRALAFTSPDCFRGTHDYRYNRMRDGDRLTLTTPLGEISEYGVFSNADKQEWPSEILQLGPVYGLLQQWRTSLEEIERTNAK